MESGVEVKLTLSGVEWLKVGMLFYKGISIKNNINILINKEPEPIHVEIILTEEEKIALAKAEKEAAKKKK